jgi:hypothetical protein
MVEHGPDELKSGVSPLSVSGPRSVRLQEILGWASALPMGYEKDSSKNGPLRGSRRNVHFGDPSFLCVSCEREVAS